MADTAVKEIADQIKIVVTEGTSKAISDEATEKITKWTTEIATTNSTWVKIRNTLYIISVTSYSPTIITKVTKLINKL